MHHSMPQQELNDLMHAATTDAILYVKEEHDIALDHSIDSLQQLDMIMSKLNAREQKQKHAPEVVFTLCNIFGAYIGEVFIANVGGHWQQNNADTSAPFVYVQFYDKEFPFASICYHKISREDSISLYDYVKQAMANAMQ